MTNELKWRSMDSAPKKHGERILILWEFHHVEYVVDSLEPIRRSNIGNWDPRNQKWTGFLFQEMGWVPKAWMPIPHYDGGPLE